MIFLYWIRQIKNFFVSLNSPYKYRQKVDKPRTDTLCEYTLFLEEELAIVKAHRNIPKKSKLQLNIEFVLSLVVTLSFYGLLVYLFRRK
jgi:hypothetical protein